MTLSNRLSRVTAYGFANPYSQTWKETTDRAATARRPSSPAARLMRSDAAMPRGYPRRFAEAWLRAGPVAAPRRPFTVLLGRSPPTVFRHRSRGLRMHRERGRCARHPPDDRFRLTGIRMKRGWTGGWRRWRPFPASDSRYDGGAV